MIRTDAEYRGSLKQLEDGEAMLRVEEAMLRKKGLTAKQVQEALQPTRFFQDQIRSEVVTYERLKRQEFDELHNLQGLGELLIALRIASGLSQCELAERMGVHESQVSRDERNEYSGVTVDRANRIIEVLGAVVTTRVEKVLALARSA
ncbi:MAG: helix-turn-helix domain-containing protein [Tepidisphaerales bacterium]